MMRRVTNQSQAGMNVLISKLLVISVVNYTCGRHL